MRGETGQKVSLEQQVPFLHRRWFYDGIRSLNTWAVLCLLLFFGFVLYSNTFFNQLFWDDREAIINNEYIRDWQYFPKYFTENLSAGSGVITNYWRPLVLFSFSLDYKLGGLDPFFYHLQNLLWHVASSFLVFQIGLRLFRSRLSGFLAGLLFLFHPLQTEAVTYVSGRADPMHTAFLLLAFLYFIRALKTAERADTFQLKNYNNRSFILSMVFFLFAILSKERAVVFPILALSYILISNFSHLKKGFLVGIIWTLPFFVLTSIYLVLRTTILHFAHTFDWNSTLELGGESAWIKMELFLESLTIYAKLIIWPAVLNMERRLQVPDAGDMSAILIGGIVLLSLLTLAWRLLKKNPIHSFCISWFFIALLPSLHVLPIQANLYEHWLYPAFPGLFLVIADSVSNTLPSLPRFYRMIAVLIAVVIFIALGTRTFLRNGDWQSPEIFFEKTIEAGGSSARVYTNLGMAYRASHQNQKAIWAYGKAIERDEALFQPWFNLGNLYYLKQDFDLAIENYMEALERNPGYVPAIIGLSLAYESVGERDQSREVISDALSKNSQDYRLLDRMNFLMGKISH